MEAKQLFNGIQKVSPEVYNYYKDRVEKEFIINSLSELPIEKLKELVSFKVVNPFDKQIHVSFEEAEHRDILANQRVIELSMKINL